MAIVLIFMVLSSFLNAVQPFLFRAILDVGSHPTFSQLFYMAAAILLFTLFNSLQKYFRNRLQKDIAKALRINICTTLCNSYLHDAQGFSAGDLVARYDNDVEKVAAAVNEGFFGILDALLLFCFAVAGMYSISVSLFITAAAITGASFLAPLLAGKFAQKSSTRAQDANGDALSLFHQIVTSLPTIKAYGIENSESVRVVSALDRKYRADLSVIRVESFVKPVGTIIVQVAMLVSLAFAIYNVKSGLLSVGSLVAFVMYLFMMMGPLGQAAEAFMAYKIGTGARDRVSELLRIRSESDYQSSRMKNGILIPNYPEDCSKNSNSVREVKEENFALGQQYSQSIVDVSADRSLESPLSTRPAIYFKNVFFNYDFPSSRQQNPFMLGPINFTVPQGLRCAIFGRSGSGKSTILQLIERFYEPTSGEIFVDGISYQELSMRESRQRFAYIGQNPQSTGRTIREDLEMSRKHLTLDEVFSVLKKVGLEYLLARIDEPIGDGGTELSGGERQRLAWCRALLSKAHIFLMDEPTSSLDPISASFMSKMIDDLPSDHALLVVTHRISEARYFDKIIFMDDGKIVNSGTHEELQLNCPQYRTLTTAQENASD